MYCSRGGRNFEDFFQLLTDSFGQFVLLLEGDPCSPRVGGRKRGEVSLSWEEVQGIGLLLHEGSMGTQILSAAGGVEQNGSGLDSSIDGL